LTKHRLVNPSCYLARTSIAGERTARHSIAADANRPPGIGIQRTTCATDRPAGEGTTKTEAKIIKSRDTLRPAPTQHSDPPTQQSRVGDRRDEVDGGAVITADFTINGHPIRLALRHQGFEDFTQRSDASGIDAAVDALGHVAHLVNTEADLLRRALTPPDVYTVIGVWQDDEPIPVGVIAGDHEVTDGDDSEFEDGLWATSVVAPDAATAQQLAIDEMRTTLL
jgi:hypothetical protein